MPPRIQIPTIDQDLGDKTLAVLNDLSKFDSLVKVLLNNYSGYTREQISEAIIECYSIIGRYVAVEPRLSREQVESRVSREQYEEYTLAVDWRKSLNLIEDTLKKIREDFNMDADSFQYNLTRIIETTELMVNILKLRGKPNFTFES